MFHILRATAPCPVLMYCSLFWSSAQVSQYARWQTIFYKEKRDFIFLFINISSKPSLSLSVNEADLVIKVIHCKNLMFYHIFKYLYKSIKSHLGSKISIFSFFKIVFAQSGQNMVTAVTDWAFTSIFDKASQPASLSDPSSKEL